MPKALYYFLFSLFLYNNFIQRMVLRPATSAESRNLLEMQVLRPIESKPLGVWLGDLFS